MGLIIFGLGSGALYGVFRLIDFVGYSIFGH